MGKSLRSGMIIAVAMGLGVVAMPSTMEAITEARVAMGDSVPVLGMKEQVLYAPAPVSDGYPQAVREAMWEAGYPDPIPLAKHMTV